MTLKQHFEILVSKDITNSTVVFCETHPRKIQRSDPGLLSRIRQNSKLFFNKKLSKLNMFKIDFAHFHSPSQFKTVFVLLFAEWYSLSVIMFSSVLVWDSAFSPADWCSNLVEL